MNCESARDKFSMYIDKMLTDDETTELRKHLDECSECRDELFLLLDTINSVNRLEEIEFPHDFHQSIMERIEQERKNEKAAVIGIIGNVKKPFYKRRIFYGSAAAIFLILIISVVALNESIGYKTANNELSATGASNTSAPMASQSYPQEASDIYYDGGYDTSANVEYEMKESLTNKAMSEEMPMADMAVDEEYAYGASETVGRSGGESGTAGAVNTPAQQNRKIIRNASMDIEVDNYDYASNVIQSLAESSGGYVESSNSYVYTTYIEEGQAEERQLKRGNISIRVPAGAFYDIKSQFDNLGSVLNSSENSQEVTAQYIDIEARLKVKKEEEERLLEIMKKADKIEDLITLERQLGIIRSEVESYQATLNNLDRLTQFSTINLSISEKYPVQMKMSVDQTFFTRLNEGFITSLNSFQYGVEDLVISFARNFVQIIVFVAVALTVLVIAIKILRRKKD